jgi:hypothetical protein
LYTTPLFLSATINEESVAAKVHNVKTSKSEWLVISWQQVAIGNDPCKISMRATSPSLPSRLTTNLTTHNHLHPRKQSSHHHSHKTTDNTGHGAAATMPPIPPRQDDISFPLLARTLSLLKRASDHGHISRPQKIGPGVLVVFCLLGASLGLIAWWLFIRRSGFIWRDYDWAEYKASVLRRPEERPDDAITVFSDGTARKGGPQGSSVGARTVVLGELDTTYTKSYVSQEKPWGPRDLPAGKNGKKKGLIGTAIDDVAESVLGRLRGGGPPGENDTIVQRNKSLRRSRHRNSKRERHHKSHHKSRRHRHHHDEDTDVDTQLPAPPLTDLTTSSAAAPAPLPRKSQPARVPSKRQRSTQRHREPSYAIGDDRAGGGARYHRHRRTESAAAAEESSSSDSSDTSSDDSSTDSDDDSSSEEESEIGPSEIGMGQGNKVYHHPITQDRMFWGNARPVERNGGGAGGTYGGGVPALMAPGPSRGRGYRAASVGSLSSEGSVRSSNAGR